MQISADRCKEILFLDSFSLGKHHEERIYDDHWRACSEILLKVSTATAMDS